MTLYALKARAVARREMRIPADSTTAVRQVFYIDQWKGAETDLDRAIELAEQYRARNDYRMLAVERDLYRSRALFAEEHRDELRQELDQARQDVLKFRDELKKALKVLDIAYTAGNEIARCGITMDPDWPKIQDEAYEAVGDYLYHGLERTREGDAELLASTDHYEQHRQTQEEASGR